MSSFRPFLRRFAVLAAVATAAVVSLSLVAPSGAAFADSATGVSVTITVTDPAGQPVSGDYMRLFNDYTYAQWAPSSESAGSFTFADVAPGDYFISISAPDADYTSIVTYFTVGTDPVTLAEQFAAASSISGTVSGVDDGDMTGAEVRVLDSEGRTVASVSISDPQGNYTVPGLNPGSYTLEFNGPTDSTYVSTSMNVTVAAGESLTGYNATLQPPATISGKVTGSDHPGVGLAGISILAYNFRDFLVGEVTSDSNGNYSIPLLPGAYTLQFRDDAGTDYLGQYYDQETEANATPITVGMADVTGKNAALELGGSLSGRVTDALTGLGVPNATVYLDPLDGNPPATAEADANGFYTVHSILPGSYSVRYDLEGINGIAYDYATQYWNNHSEESDSDPVTFASGTTVVNHDVALVPLFDMNAIPTISGTAAVGNVLTASSGPWTPAATISYQWLRNGVAIAGATDSTYTVANADGGSTLKVMATGSHTGYSTESLPSGATATVTGAIFATTTPTISGSAVVGQSLTVVTGTWSPQASFSYSWKRGTLTVSTDSSYTLAAADLGQTITVTVTGSEASVTSASATSAPTGTVVAATLTATPVPIVTGNPAVGQTISTTVSPNDWQPSMVTLGYQWSRDGVAISGATTNTYTLTNADAGSTMTVTVTGTQSGYTAAAMTSAATAMVAGGALTATPTPTIRGTTTVGEILGVDVGTWLPAPVTLAYQWNRDGTAIAGATDSSYQLTGADAASTITVSVAGSRAGFADVSTTSLATAAIAIGGFTATPTPGVSGSPIVGSVLTAVPGGWAPGSVAFAYQWNRNGVPIGGATAQSYILTNDDALSSVSVTVTGSAIGYTNASATSIGSSPVMSGAIAGTATITGIAQVGELLTVNAPFTPDPDAITYGWLADGTPIAGATGSTFAVTTAELGETIAVEVSATRIHYVPMTETTHSTAAVVAAPAADASEAVAVQGSTLTISGEGFLSSSSYDVELHSTPVFLGTVTPDANGNFTTQVTIPADTAPGTHHIVLVAADGTEFTLAEISITAATPAQAVTLAFTGANLPLGAGAAGLGALLSGIALLLIRRRRARDRTPLSR